MRSGLQGARMAGTLTMFEGKLFRYAQDCSFTYGHKVRAWGDLLCAPLCVCICVLVLCYQGCLKGGASGSAEARLAPVSAHCLGAVDPLAGHPR